MEKYTKIDLDEAIIHCQKKIKELECKEEHRKLIESDNNILKYSKFYCDECKKSGWTLDEIAEWVEEDD